MDNATLDRAADPKATFSEYLEHPIIVTEYVGLELGDTSRACQAAEMFKQNSRYAAALMGVENRERYFSSLRFKPADITRDTDDALLLAIMESCNEPHVLNEIEYSQANQFIFAQSTLYAEESVIDRILAQTLEMA
jgi:hypothetical protein